MVQSALRVTPRMTDLRDRRRPLLRGLSWLALAAWSALAAACSDRPFAAVDPEAFTSADMQTPWQPSDEAVLAFYRKAASLLAERIGFDN